MVRTRVPVHACTCACACLRLFTRCRYLQADNISVPMTCFGSDDFEMLVCGHGFIGEALMRDQEQLWTYEEPMFAGQEQDEEQDLLLPYQEREFQDQVQDMIDLIDTMFLSGDEEQPCAHVADQDQGFLDVTQYLDFAAYLDQLSDAEIDFLSNRFLAQFPSSDAPA